MFGKIKLKLLSMSMLLPAGVSAEKMIGTTYGPGPRKLKPFTLTAFTKKFGTQFLLTLGFATFALKINFVLFNKLLVKVVHFVFFD